MTDVVLKIEDESFTCNRNVLSEHSAYFYAMFNSDFAEKSKSEIRITAVEPSAMRIILQSILDEELDFSKCDNVLALLETSCMLQFDKIKDKCIKYMMNHWLCEDNLLPTVLLADKLGLVELHKKTKAMSLWMFSKIKETQSFLDVSPEFIIEYLDNKNLRTTKGEFEVFEAVIIWVEYNLEDRLFYTLQLLSVIRFQDISSFDLKNMIFYTMIKDTPQAELMIECLLKLREDKLNKDCEICFNNDLDENCDELPQSPSSGSVTKRKRRITARCTCLDPTTIEAAKKLLVKKSRTLSLMPCIVASVSAVNQFINCDSPSVIKGRVKEKTGKPYVYCWNGEDLSPVIYLSKIDEGPTEAVGYRTICKDLKIYVTGGEYMMTREGGHNMSVWVYDTWRDMWVYETALPTPLRNHALCCIDDDIYVIGGVGRHRVIENAVHKYNVVQKIWSKCPPLPIPIYSGTCCVYKDHIFLFGSVIFSYRPNGLRWETVDNINIPHNLSVSSAMTYDCWIYIIVNTSSDLYRIQPFSENVIMEHLGKFQLEGKNACIVNDSIYHFGCDQHDDKCNIEEYNIKTSEFNVLWETKSTELRLDNANGCFFLPNYCSWSVNPL
ncbi:kelch repeat and BTB domain-containing protein 8-like [Lycorma delicatula]|uniref:kelch repeat and BTB domain-containing protein 8-like n=1 Tax=Lycorma delicatula TaxID=130591 RepID=UPI003F510385